MEITYITKLKCKALIDKLPASRSCAILNYRVPHEWLNLSDDC